MRNIKNLKKEVRALVGNFSKREFREAYIFVLRKYRKYMYELSFRREDWYMAILIKETIYSNRFSLWTQIDCNKMK